MTNMQILFSFNGRIRRLQWWVGTLLTMGVMLAVVFVSMLVVTSVFGDVQNVTAAASGIMGLVFVACYIAVIWIQLALGVKRLHDRENTGWWMLLGFVPIGGFVLLVMVGFLDGTQGPNKYGPSPKGIGGTTGDRELGSMFS